MDKKPSPPILPRIAILVLLVSAAIFGFWIAYRTNSALYGENYARISGILGILTFVVIGGYLLMKFFLARNHKQ